MLLHFIENLQNVLAPLNNSKVQQLSDVLYQLRYMRCLYDILIF